MQTLKQSVFVEQMIKRGTKEKDNMKRFVIVLLGLIAIGIPFLLGPSVVYYAEPVVVLVAAFCVWIFWRRASQEYEYIYTDGNLDIDVIYGQTSRKHLVTFDARSVKIIAPANDPKAQAATRDKGATTIYACRGAVEDGTYVIVGEYRSKLYHVYFEPNARILKGIKTYAPAKSIIRPEDLLKKEEAFTPAKEEESDL